MEQIIALGQIKCIPKLLNKIVNTLASLFNTSLQQGFVSVKRKAANVTPIFKKGNKNMPENYRPNSLTCVLAKCSKTSLKTKLLVSCDYIL